MIINTRKEKKKRLLSCVSRHGGSLGGVCCAASGTHTKPLPTVVAIVSRIAGCFFTKAGDERGCVVGWTWCRREEHCQMLGLTEADFNCRGGRCLSELCICALFTQRVHVCVVARSPLVSH